MLTHLHADPRLKDLRRGALFTRDAHGLYEQFGWFVGQHPERLMLHDNPEAFAA
jgi:hypothetical protein